LARQKANKQRTLATSPDFNSNDIPFESPLEDSLVLQHQLMFYRTPFAFAIFSAVSASLMVLLGGMAVLSVYWVLIHLTVITEVSFFKVPVLILVTLAVFVASVPIEFVYARRRLFGGSQRQNLKPVFLLFPSLIATLICSQIFLRRKPAPPM
jgi:hypothetical protein